MCAKLGSSKLNTVVFRASYILPILRQFSCPKSSKTRGGDLPPPNPNPWKIQNRTQFVFLSFRVDPLYWLSFIEIGEMACSRPAWCTHGHVLNTRSVISFPDIFQIQSAHKRSEDEIIRGSLELKTMTRSGTGERVKKFKENAIFHRGH